MQNKTIEKQNKNKNNNNNNGEERERERKRKRKRKKRKREAQAERNKTVCSGEGKSLDDQGGWESHTSAVCTAASRSDTNTFGSSVKGIVVVAAEEGEDTG